MAATSASPPATTPPGSGVANPADSTISSPLTDVDDKDADDEDIKMHLDHDAEENTSNLSLDDQQDAAADGSDSESALSEVRSVANFDNDNDVDGDGDCEGNDTDAETERLYNTPREQKRRDVVVDQFNTRVFEHTPTKLRGTAINDEDYEQSLSGRGPSSVNGQSDQDTPTKPSAKSSTIDDDFLLESLDRKRKRSTETSESDQPIRKRKGSIVIPAADLDQDTPADDDDTASALANTAGESRQTSPDKREVEIEATPRERETRATKKGTRSHTKKRKSAAADVAETDVDGHNPNGDARNGGAEDEGEQINDVLDADTGEAVEGEEEADAAAKNAEEVLKKQSAFTDWSRIEGMFGIFRERLYKDRLERLEEEEQSLLADEPTHSEYLNMKQCLDDRLNQKLEEINKEHELRMLANQRRAVAIRSQIWSQFYQSIREGREAILESLNREWYDVQTTRRSAHSTQDCGILFPKDPTQRIKNSVAYNTEVSTLAGIAKHEGFPAGPEMSGASATELADDLDAIQRSRRMRQQRQAVPREEYQTPTFNRLGPAGEQFLKETPWANPNHSAHKTSYSQKSGPLDGRAESALLAGRAMPSSSTPTAIDTSHSAHRSPALPNRLTEPPELARSLLKSTTTLKTAGNIPTIARGKTAAA